MTKKLIALACAAALFASCGADNVNTPRGSMEVPQQVTVKGVKNISGAAVVYFDRPTDNNLKYVKAVWTTDDKEEYTQTISRYTDSVLVNGFGEQGSYTVRLYSVSPGGKESQPVTATVNPERPPYLVAYDKLQIMTTFMGIRVVTENETRANLAFRVSKQNLENGEWEEVGMEYLTVPGVDFVNRGHEAEIPQNFRVQVRDRWGHWSEPKEATISPWFEKELDRTQFKEVAMCNLSGDGLTVPDQTGQHLPSNFWGHKMHSWSGSNVSFGALYDGDTTGTQAKCYHTKPTGRIPLHFTTDLGGLFNLSRMQLWSRNDPNNSHFRNGHPLVVEIFAATYNGDDPYELVDDIYDTEAWQSLGEFTLARADGSTDAATGTLSAEDAALFTAGHEMSLEPSTAKVRYIRVMVKQTYQKSSMGAAMIGEIAYFGSDK